MAGGGSRRAVTREYCSRGGSGGGGAGNLVYGRLGLDAGGLTTYHSVSLDPAGTALSGYGSSTIPLMTYLAEADVVAEASLVSNSITPTAAVGLGANLIVVVGNETGTQRISVLSTQTILNGVPGEFDLSLVGATISSQTGTDLVLDDTLGLISTTTGGLFWSVLSLSVSAAD